MQQDGQQTFKSLFRRYYAVLLSYARSLVGDDEAEDVVEDVFVELWQHQDQMVLGDRIQGWLYRAVYTRSLNVLKHRHVTSAYLAMTESLNERRMMNLDLYSPQQYVENEALRERLDGAIGELPEKCREVFRLSYMFDMRNKEIAEALDISVKTVEAHMYKALKHLRERLKDVRSAMLLLLLCLLQ